MVNIAVFCLLAASGCSAEEPKATAVIGAWKVSDLYCEGCAAGDTSEVGTLLYFGTDKVNDPLSAFNCKKDISYSSVPLQAPQLQELKSRINPQWGTGRALQFVEVNCGGLTFAMVAQLSDQLLVYFMEGTVSFRLDRQP